MATIYETDEYWSEHSTYHEGDAKFKATGCFDALQEAGLAPTTVLDIGCGSGKFLYELSEMLPTAEFLGVDVSPTPINRANSMHAKANVKFEVGQASKIEGTFDLVTANDVIEHVDDYIGFLRDIRKIGRNFYFNIPLDMTAFSVARHAYLSARSSVGHLHYFSKQSALATLEYCGFAVLHHRYNHAALHAVRTHPTVRTYIAALPRLTTFKIAPDASVHFLSGASLGVVCRQH
ncbi:class I SAM-dependent methyltransferase [Mesorhizobium sp. M0984]|uniref:class I SAM-dependent methyltransferase n=1 Tax=Mesorhizobium sp. M0984 TaxID=2957041 RepID=UPI00333BA1D3